MAREYGRLMLSVWDDKEYQALSLADQGMFCALLAYPGISWCGVIDFIPKRLTRISNELTTRELSERLTALDQAGFIVADESSDELLVRRFVHYDGIMKMPNVAKAMAKAVDKIHSLLLREICVGELARLWREQPEMRGWEGLQEGFGELLTEIMDVADEGCPNPSPNPSGNPLPNPSADPWGQVFSR